MTFYRVKSKYLRNHRRATGACNERRQTDLGRWGPKKIEQAPFFIRKIAKNKVEKAALAQGETRITVDFVEQVRQKESNS